MAESRFLRKEHGVSTPTEVNLDDERKIARVSVPEGRDGHAAFKITGCDQSTTELIRVTAQGFESVKSVCLNGTLLTVVYDMDHLALHSQRSRRSHFVNATSTNLLKALEAAVTNSTSSDSGSQKARPLQYRNGTGRGAKRARS